MYRYFTLELLFRECQGSDEDTQSRDADYSTGKFCDVCCIVPLCSNKPNLGLGWGWGLNNSAQDQTWEVSQGEDQVGNPGCALRPQPRDKGEHPSFASVLFHMVVCSSKNNMNNSNLFI